MDNLNITIPTAQLKLVMRAAKRCLKYLTMMDVFTSGGLTCESDEMFKAYKAVETLMKGKTNERNKVSTK